MEYMILIVLILSSFTIASISGFGSSILLLTIGLNFFSLKFLLPVTLPLNVILNMLIALKNYKSINKKVITGIIIPFFPIGFIAGIALFYTIPIEKAALAFFGIFIILTSIRDYRNKQNEENTNRDNLQIKILILIAGVMHGIFATGGPLLVYAINKLNLKKEEFRSTLPVVWSTMNIILIGTYIHSNLLNFQTARYTLILIPFAVLGFIAGEIIHNRIDELLFKKFITLLLIISGLLLVIKNSGALSLFL